MVNGINGRDVKESAQPRTSRSAYGLQSFEQRPVTEQYARDFGHVNVVSCQDRQHPAAGHGLRPDAVPFVSALGQPPAQRQSENIGYRETFYSCPDIGQWDTVAGGGIRQQLPPALEIRRSLVDNPVVMGQQPVVSEVNRYQLRRR